MSMTYSDCFLTELCDVVLERLQQEGRCHNGKFLEGEYNRIERELMKEKIDELYAELEKIRTKSEHGF